MIAGHLMATGLHGLACINCGRRFVDIAGAREADIGQEGYAHTGSLTRAEWEQIRAEVERQWTCLVGVASGRGIGGMAPGTETGAENG